MRRRDFQIRPHFLFNRLPMAMVVLLMMVLSSCSTWHYHHARVRIDVDQTNRINEVKINSTQLAAVEDPTNESSIARNEISIAEKKVVDQSPVINTDASTLTNYEDGNQATSFEKQMSTHHLLKVSKVEKTSLSGWMRIMIILFAVGLLLIILGAIFSAVLPGGFWWFFYLIGSLCIIAGFVILVLGLLGIM